jgi:hypothetical protein
MKLRKDYIDGFQLARKFGIDFTDFIQRERTNEFINLLSQKENIARLDLVITDLTGKTYIHPTIATYMSCAASTEFIYSVIKCIESLKKIEKSINLIKL